MPVLPAPCVRPSGVVAPTRAFSVPGLAEKGLARKVPLLAKPAGLQRNRSAALCPVPREIAMGSIRCGGATLPRLLGRHDTALAALNTGKDAAGPHPGRTAKGNGLICLRAQFSILTGAARP